MKRKYFVKRNKQATADGLDRLSVRMDQQRYETECRKSLEVFHAAPSEETLQASHAALIRYQEMHARWIAPALDKLNKGKPMNNFYRAQNGSPMSVLAAVSMGIIYRGVEEGTVVINGNTMKASTAIEAGMIDAEAAETISKLPGTDKPAPHIREDAPPPAEPEASTSVSMAEALGKFFTNPADAATKLMVEQAIKAHYEASLGAKQ